MNMQPHINRRDFVAQFAGATAAFSLGSTRAAAQAPAPARRAISFFSKQLHWLDCKDAFAVAAELGIDGLDLTVRPGGHVLPERVKDDLPKAAEAAKANGVRLEMIVTSIADPDEPHARAVLETAAKVGVRHYRTNWYKYDKSAPVDKSLADIEARLRALGQLNQELGIRGGVQNHAGDYFGAAIWDLWFVLRNIKSEWIGCQYDIRHATLEGLGCWHHGLAAIMPHIDSLNFKDFAFREKDGKTVVENVPLGTGFVNFKRFLKLLSGPAASAPASLHSEYLPERHPPSGKLDRDQIFATIRKDVATLRSLLA